MIISVLSPRCFRLIEFYICEWSRSSSHWLLLCSSDALWPLAVSLPSSSCPYISIFLDTPPFLPALMAPRCCLLRVPIVVRLPYLPLGSSVYVRNSPSDCGLFLSLLFSVWLYSPSLWSCSSPQISLNFPCTIFGAFFLLRLVQTFPVQIIFKQYPSS